MVDGKDGEAMVGEQFEDTENVFDEGISSSGVVDMDGRAITDEQLMCGALEKILAKHGDAKLKVGVGNVPVNEYENVNLFYDAFPTLFMYGCGAPRLLGAGIVTKIPFAAHIKHLFNMKFRRFARHRLFPFAVLNMMQRQTICRSVKAFMPSKQFQDAIEEFSDLDPTEIQHVINNIQQGKNVQEAIRGAAPVVQRLLKALEVQTL